MYILFTWLTSFTEYANYIFKLISNFTFKDTNLAEHQKKWGSPLPMEPAFCKSGGHLGLQTTASDDPTFYQCPKGCDAKKD